MRRALGVALTEASAAILGARRGAPRGRSPERPRRAFVVELSRLGDAVQASAVVGHGAREGWADEVLFAVDEAWAPLFQGAPGLDAVVAVPAGGRRVSDLLRLGIERSDLAVNVSPSVRNTLAVFGSAARSKVGYLDWTSPLTPFRSRRHVIRIDARSSTSRVVAPGTPLAARARPVLELLGGALEPPRPRLVPAPDASVRAARRLGEADLGAIERLVVLHPGANWRFRAWPPDRWIRLGLRLVTELDACPVVVGSQIESGLVAGILESLGAAARSFVGAPIADVAAVIASARVLVGNDSGLVHLAAALGTPTIGLYGPASPDLTAPGGLAAPVSAPPYPCSPCDQRHCVRPVDPCIHAIAVNDVFQAVARLWESSSSHQPGATVVGHIGVEVVRHRPTTSRRKILWRLGFLG